jgi:hypothetical protein
MDFDRLRIGEGEYLIPRQTWLQVIARDAGFTENTIAHTGCREFRVESVVRFDDAAPLADPGSKPSASVHSPSLPAGLPIVLDAEIDTSRAAA